MIRQVLKVVHQNFEDFAARKVEFLVRLSVPLYENQVGVKFVHRFNVVGLFSQEINFAEGEFVPKNPQRLFQIFAKHRIVFVCEVFIGLGEDFDALEKVLVQDQFVGRLLYLPFDSFYCVYHWVPPKRKTHDRIGMVP